MSGPDALAISSVTAHSWMYMDDASQCFGDGATESTGRPLTAQDQSTLGPSYRSPTASSYSAIVRGTYIFTRPTDTSATAAHGSA